MALLVSVHAFAIDETLLMKAVGDYSEAEGLKMMENAPAGNDGKLYRGIILHNIADSKMPQYEEQAVSELKQVKDTDPVARVYYGSVLTLKAGTASKKKDLVGAIALLNQGFGEMDKAVKEAPANITVRFCRLINSIEVSADSPMKRYNIAKGDLAFLNEHVDELEAKDKALLYFWEGEYYMSQRKTSEALASFKKSAEVTPKTLYGTKAEKRIAAIND